MSNLDTRMSSLDIRMSRLDIRVSKVILESGKTETAKNSRLDVAFRMYRQHLVKIIWPAGCHLKVHSGLHY